MVFVAYVHVLLVTAVLAGDPAAQRRTVYQRHRIGRLPESDPELKPVLDGLYRRYRQVITTSDDFDQVPRNLSDLDLVFAADHRIQFGRGTLPAELGGAQLEHLQISVRYAPRRVIPRGLFMNLSRLRTLQLYNDAPDAEGFSLTLSSGAFEGLSVLDELVLARLGIRNLPAGVFRGLRSIRRLNLSQNRLAVIRLDVFGAPPAPAPSSEELGDGSCCPNLTALQLGRNRFVDVGDIQLSSLTKLRFVDLYDNEIARLVSDGFRAWSTNIEELNLDYNVVNLIENGAFERLTKLRVIWLLGNAIRDTNASAFRGLSRLWTLDLRSNSISALKPGVFAPLRTLRKLVIANNEVKTVQMGAFFGLNDLQELDLSGNRLRTLANETLLGLNALEQLNIRDNLVVEVGSSALTTVARSLTDLDLTNNSLQTVDFQTLAVAERLNVVYLTNNSWVCDCRLSRPVDVGSETLKSAWDHIICEHPDAVRGRSLSDVLAVDPVCGFRRSSTEQPTSAAPFDADGRRWRFVYLAIATVTVIGVIAVPFLVVAVTRRVRHSASWSPPEDKYAYGITPRGSVTTILVSGWFH